MKRKLEATEREKLIRQHRREKNRKICDRIKAVLLFDRDYSYQEIAHILLLDDDTVRRHINDYFAKHKLTIESGGSSSHLNVEHTVMLKAHLDENTYLYVKDICEFVKSKFSISYSISGMTKWLKNQGYRYKKPQPVPGKVNSQAQEDFKVYYEELKNKAGDEEPIYFADSVHPQHQTRLAYGWIQKGVRKNVATTGKQKRLSFMGGLCLNGHKVVVQNSEKVDTESIKVFLKVLRSKHRVKNKIHIIWDNAGYHRSKEVQSFADKLNIKLHFLPPYSPNLNPIERLWKIMHEKVTYNKYYQKFSDFTEAITTFFKQIGRKKKLLRARLTDKFQIVSEPNFGF
ncbi:IS630 family transposase [Legionella yabuuchiae]|uniref:IS630 family transposase n=1 Tax=Legionella yabuuchiae TaxID=376727 RepID=UPI0010542C2B|nr:IS630 family transposase [Legionella yabuuchiae]